jgi:hypothetical protein
MLLWYARNLQSFSPSLSYSHIFGSLCTQPSHGDEVPGSTGQSHRVVLTLRKTVREVRAEGDHFVHELEALVSMLIVAAAGAPNGDHEAAAWNRQLQIVRIGAATARGPEPHVEVDLEVGGVPPSVLREALTPTFFERIGQLDDVACQALGEQLVCPATVEPAVIGWGVTHPEPEPEPQSLLQPQPDLLLPALSQGWSHQPMYTTSESSRILETGSEIAGETSDACSIEDTAEHGSAEDQFKQNLLVQHGSRAGRKELTAVHDPHGDGGMVEQLEQLSVSRPRRLTRTEIAEMAEFRDESNYRSDESFETARGEFSVLSSPTYSLPLTSTISAHE